MRQQPAEAAAIVLAEEIQRRAAGPDHMAFDAVTWSDRSHSGGYAERWAARSTDPKAVARRILPIAVIGYYNPGWLQ